MSSKARLGDILLEAGEIDAAQLDAALREQEESGRPLGITLVRMGALREESLVRTLARQLALPMARLEGKRIGSEVLELLPFELAEKHRCFPLLVKSEGEGRALYLGMEDASDLAAIEEIGAATGVKIRPVLVAPSEIEEALRRQYQTLIDGDPAASSVAPQAGSPADSSAERLPPPPSDPGFDGTGLSAELGDFDADGLSGGEAEFDSGGLHDGGAPNGRDPDEVSDAAEPGGFDLDAASDSAELDLCDPGEPGEAERRPSGQGGRLEGRSDAQRGAAERSSSGQGGRLEGRSDAQRGAAERSSSGLDDDEPGLSDPGDTGVDELDVGSEPDLDLALDIGAPPESYDPTALSSQAAAGEEGGPAAEPEAIPSFEDSLGEFGPELDLDPPPDEPESESEGVQEPEIDAADAGPERPDPPAAASRAAPDPESDAASVSRDAILRALTQLLVEKGLIERDELIARVHRESQGD